MSISRYRTEDGSDTLYNPDFDEHYHNRKGAVSESRHVFFEVPGLLDKIKQNESLRIFETGFGSGLNLLLLLQSCEEHNFSGFIDYHSVEAYPISADLFNSLNFEAISSYHSFVSGIFQNLHSGFNRFHHSGKFRLDVTIYSGFISSMEYTTGSPLSDFIWHDAFAPDANPDLWTHSTFSKLYRWSSNCCILSTYAAAVIARAGMCASGWFAGRAPGALGKREMTLAAKHPDLLDNRKRVNKQNLAQRYWNGEFITHPTRHSPFEDD